MKKIILFFCVLVLCFSFFSCAPQPSSYDMLSDFMLTYGIDGVIYTPNLSEWEDGYITDELFGKIYIYEGRVPENYALFLNSYADYGSECAVFVCKDVEEREDIIEMCEERISLFGKGDKAFIVCADNIIFYSTLSDKVRAEEVWRKIIREHT